METGIHLRDAHDPESLRLYAMADAAKESLTVKEDG